MAALWKGFSRTTNKRKIQARRPAVVQVKGVPPDDDGDVSDEEDNDD
jgi:hypothetical protein